MKKALQHNQNGTIQRVIDIVKRDNANIEQIAYILDKRNAGETYRQIQKDLLKDLNSDISIQRINEIYLTYKEVVKYV